MRGVPGMGPWMVRPPSQEAVADCAGVRLRPSRDGKAVLQKLFRQTAEAKETTKGVQMKVYVASSWRNEHQQSVVDALWNDGHAVYDFKHPAQGDAGFHWSRIDSEWQNWTTKQYREELNHEYAKFGFNRDFDAMKDADACVLVLPCGRSAIEYPLLNLSR